MSKTPLTTYVDGQLRSNVDSDPTNLQFHPPKPTLSLPPHPLLRRPSHAAAPPLLPPSAGGGGEQCGRKRKELRGAGRGRSGGPASARRPHGAAATADDGRDGEATGGRRARPCPASAWRLPPPPTGWPPDPPQAGRVRLPAAFSWGAGLLTSAACPPRARPQGAARRGLLRSDAGGWEDAGGDGEGEREGQFGRVELQICWIRVHVGSELAVHVGS